MYILQNKDTRNVITTASEYIQILLQMKTDTHILIDLI